MSEAGAHCHLPAASAWRSVWPVPCPWLGILLLQRLYPSAAQHPSETWLGDTGGYSAPIACGSSAVPEVVWMSAASAWFILRRLCNPAPEPVVLCSFRAHHPLSQGAASSLLQAMYYFMSLTTRNLSPPCFPLALMLVPGCTQTIHSKVKIAAGLLWLLFLWL